MGRSLEGMEGEQDTFGHGGLYEAYGEDELLHVGYDEVLKGELAELIEVNGVDEKHVDVVEVVLDGRDDRPHYILVHPLAREELWYQLAVHLVEHHLDHVVQAQVYRLVELQLLVERHLDPLAALRKPQALLPAFIGIGHALIKVIDLEYDEEDRGQCALLFAQGDLGEEVGGFFGLEFFEGGDDGPDELDVEFSFELGAEYFDLLVEEVEDVFGVVRDQLLPLLDEALEVLLRLLLLLVLEECLLAVVAHEAAHVLQEVRHVALHAGLEHLVGVCVQAHSLHQVAVRVHPVQQHDQRPVRLLHLLFVLQKGQHPLLDVRSVLTLEHVEDLVMRWEALHRVVQNQYQIVCCEPGVLKHEHGLVFAILQLILELLIDAEPDFHDGPVLLLGRLGDPQKSDEQGRLLEGEQQRELEGLEHRVVVTRFEGRETRKLLNDDLHLLLPAYALHHVVPDFRQGLQLIVDALEVVLALLEHHLHLLYLGLHVEQVLQLVQHQPHVLPANAQSLERLHLRALLLVEQHVHLLQLTFRRLDIVLAILDQTASGVNIFDLRLNVEGHFCLQLLNDAFVMKMKLVESLRVLVLPAVQEFQHLVLSLLPGFFFIRKIKHNYLKIDIIKSTNLTQRRVRDLKSASSRSTSITLALSCWAGSG